MNERRYYLVRSCHTIPLNTGWAGMGWDDIPFADFNCAEDIIKDIVEVKKWGIGRRANQIRRFKKIAKGDVVVVPRGGTIVIGLATGEEQYDRAFYGKNGCNQIGLNFLKDNNGQVLHLPRANFSEGFQRRLKIRITVADLSAFQTEINHCLERLESGKSYSWSSGVLEKNEAQVQQFKDSLLHNIRTGETNLESGGYGLEKLVQELLIIDGYTATIAAKNAFPELSDADIEARKSDALTSTDLLIQVKHHQGDTGTWGLDQLAQLPEEYNDFNLALVTTGEINDEVQSYADSKKINTMDGEQLIDWIYDSIPKLSTKTKLLLGVCEVPQLNLV